MASLHSLGLYPQYLPNAMRMCLGCRHRVLCIDVQRIYIYMRSDRKGNNYDKVVGNDGMEFIGSAEYRAFRNAVGICRGWHITSLHTHTHCGMVSIIK